MRADDLSFVGTALNLDEVEPINQKRLLAFVNHWICQTVQLLNDFANSSDGKLSAVESKLRQLDGCLVLLENKLSTIPALKDQVMAAEPVEHPAISSSQQNEETVVAENAPPVEEAGEDESVPKTESVPEGGVKARDHWLYEKYFKMLKLGVPVQGVQQKMLIEGVDPAVLDQPDAIIAGKRADEMNGKSAGSSSEPEFSSDED